MLNNKSVLRFLVMLCAYSVAIAFSYGLTLITRSWHPLFQLFIIFMLVTIFFWFLSILFQTVLFQAFEGIFVSLVVFMNVNSWNISIYLMVFFIIGWGFFRTISSILAPPSYYEEKNKTKRYFLINLLMNHLIPGIIVYFLVLAPIHFLDLAVREPLNLSTLIAIGITALGFVIWLISTYQRFRFDQKKTKKILDIGLWRWSRHPDIFGEISFWFGIFLMMLSLDMNMWILVLGPLMNFLFFVWYRLPRLEARLLIQKEDYQRYQQRTNLLLVLPSEKTK